MVAVSFDRNGQDKAKPVLDPPALAFLNHLRFVAMACRVKPRTRLFEACALLHVDHVATRDASAEMLMRCLTEALGHPARLYGPGTAEVTFDEQWLIALARAFTRDDLASQRFLLNSRIPHQNRRLIGFLMAQTVMQMDSI